ncbi:hypothetical protein FE257_002534 [Aspergillus nanangensis]|uniref:Uncharacterized protein n=1 Tax=Aspergillus nanangensis TaxID=2582783 RepID=A0AAD4CUQ6_ASPNN|nr:hypothetical protein FE257_002534 [Aspergillus nanangensis]
MSPYLMVNGLSSFIDLKILMALPNLITSPYVHLDPALHVIYYNAIYFGQSCGTLVEQKASSRTYYMCLQAAQAWLNSARGTELDLFAAMGTTWSAINNFDYHVSWRLHREACRFANILGLHELATGLQYSGDKTVDAKRSSYLYLTATDLMFRLWYDKPSALAGPISEACVSIAVECMTRHSKASISIMNMVWGRAISILLDFFTTSQDAQPEREAKIERCCNEIEDLLDDWDLMSMIKIRKMDGIETWVYAECIIACYSFITCIRRRSSNDSNSIHPQALKAARLVITIIGEYSGWIDPPAGEQNYFHLLFVTFYPFCAFFTLYQHIVSSPAIEECEPDLLLLEKVVHGMTQISTTRADFIPIANAMSALNKVCRALVYSSSPGQHPRQSRVVRIERPPALADEPEVLLHAPSRKSPSFANETAQQLRALSPESKHVENSTQIADDAHNIGDHPVFGGMVKPAPSSLVAADETVNPQVPGGDRVISGFEPLHIVRAIESEFAWSNWNDNWWNSSIGWEGGDLINDSWLPGEGS